MLTTQQLLRLTIGNANSCAATTTRIASFSSSCSVSSSVSVASRWWRSRNNKQQQQQQQLPMTAMKIPVSGVSGVSGVAGVGDRCCSVSRREFSVSARMASGGEHADETYEEFTIR